MISGIPEEISNNSSSSSSFDCSQSNNNERLHILHRRQRPHPLHPTVCHKCLPSPARHQQGAAIKLTCSRTRAGPSLSVAINKKPIPSDGISGSCSCIFANSILGLCWDFSAAKYNIEPEPVSDFYVAVIFYKKFALLIGDRSTELVRNASNGAHSVAEFSLVSRTVQVVGRAVYSTRARFCEEGKEHDIMIRFQGELELSMQVDEKKVLDVRRLRWNFRGNVTVFVDGLAVDVMWDLCRWLFQDPLCCAVVLLRTRAVIVGGGLGGFLTLDQSLIGEQLVASC